ncbi:MAG: enterochelin esterase domain-containing protein, partial [Actinoplanes sp.]
MPSPRITRLLASPTPRAVDEFWSEVVATGTPLVEPAGPGTVLVTFLWRGKARSVRTWWGVNVPLAPVPGTDLWYGTRELPADLRTIYCLLHDETERLPADDGGGGLSHVDALNPRRLRFPGDPDDPDDFDQWASVLELPLAPADPWSEPRRGVPAGTVTTGTLPGTALGGPRPVTVYRPPGTPTDGLPVLVSFDGFLAREL